MFISLLSDVAAATDRLNWRHSLGAPSSGEKSFVTYSVKEPE